MEWPQLQMYTAPSHYIWSSTVQTSVQRVLLFAWFGLLWQEQKAHHFYKTKTKQKNHVSKDFFVIIFFSNLYLLS